MKKCEIEDSPNPAHARGLCCKHSVRKKKGVPMDFPHMQRYSGSEERDTVLRQMFEAVYERERRTLKEGPPLKTVGCLVDGCEKAHSARGLCKSHWMMWRRNIDTEKFVNLVTAGRSCTYKDCDRKHHGRGFCKTHYNRYVRGTDMDAPMPFPQEVLKKKDTSWDMDDSWKRDKLVEIEDVEEFDRAVDFEDDSEEGLVEEFFKEVEFEDKSDDELFEEFLKGAVCLAKGCLSPPMIRSEYCRIHYHTHRKDRKIIRGWSIPI